MPESYLTTDEVAALLRIPKQKVWRLIRDKELTAHRIGRDYRINRVDFEDYMRRTRTVQEEDSKLILAG